MAIIDYEQAARTAEKRLLEWPGLSDSNRVHYLRYRNSRDVSSARVAIVARHLKILFEELDDVVGTMNDRDLVNAAMRRIRQRDVRVASGFQRISVAYLETVKSVAKAFVRWHNDGETPRGWKDVRSLGKKAQLRELSPDDMISWEDGVKLARTSNSLQIRTALLTQLDGGFRPSEFEALNVGDVRFEQNFAIVRVRKGKTGSRDAILLRAVPAIRQWLQIHPDPSPENPLWVLEHPHKSGRYRTSVGTIRFPYYALRKRLRDLAKRAGFRKPLDLYSQRHSAAFQSKLDGVDPEVASKKFGHSIRHYVETYGRLSTKHHLAIYCRTYGLATDQKKAPVPWRCPCGAVNDPGDYCYECGESPPKCSERELSNKESTITKLEEEQKVLREQLREMQELLKYRASTEGRKAVPWWHDARLEEGRRQEGFTDDKSRLVTTQKDQDRGRSCTPR